MNWPVIEDDEIKAVERVLRSGKVNYWTGKEGAEFESEFAEKFGADYAIAVANGTLALELALVGLDLKPGDEVIVPTKTFIATASSVVSRGGIPIVADIDEQTQNITADTIESRISKRTKGIICVHLGGRPCDMDPIMALANKHDLWVIEDCAQAHGAKYKGRCVGTIGDIGAFSFCQDKIMTTGGEGGMVIMNSKQLWSKMWAFKDHGKGYDQVFNCQHPPGFRWLHEGFGSNYRLTEMQSAIGRCQLKKLDRWVALRQKNASQLSDLFRAISGFEVFEDDPDSVNAYYKYYVKFDPNKLGVSKRDLIAKINEAGVRCFSGSCSEIYREKAFKAFPQETCSVAADLEERVVMFLVDPTVNIQTDCQRLKSVLV